MLNIILQLADGSELQLLRYISYMLIISAVLAGVVLQVISAPYGRYSRTGWGSFLDARLAWFIQELPSMAVPVYLMCFTQCPYIHQRPNQILLALFFLHYIQRTLIYPLLIKGGKPTTLVTFVIGISFCSVNGYLQTAHLLRWADYGPKWIFSPNFILGVLIFFTGMIINIHSDSILRNLRKPGEKDYKIPKGGMFDYVSGANFLGEILEWWGFALAAFNLPALAFAIFTVCNIGPRACQHHRWYLEKFEDYPKSRKALIPFIL